MADSLQANVITIDAQGRVGADFTGHVSAAGLDLVAADTDVAIDPDHRVSWLREADDDLVAWLAGWETAAERGLMAIVEPETGKGEAALLRAGDAQVVASDGNVAANFVDAAADRNVAEEIVRIIGGGGDSSFLQLAENPTLRRVDYGVFTPNFTAENSREDTVSHDLGVVPVAVLAIVQGGTSRYCQTYNYTDTDFTLRTKIEGAGTSSADFPVGWVAIG